MKTPIQAHPTPTLFRPSVATSFLKAVLWLASAGYLQAAIVGWSTTITFNQFAGLPGGFDDDSNGPILLATPQTPGPVTREYDLLAPTGTDAHTGRTFYGTGQDGTSDLTLRTQVFSSTGNPWRTAQMEKIDGTLGTFTTVRIGTSRPGDFFVGAYEFSFSTELDIDFKKAITTIQNTNGFGELYEWSMLTVGGIDDAPFEPEQLGEYKNYHYSDLSGSNFYTPTGGVTGNPAANTNPLPNNRTISQFLANHAGGPEQRLVQAGWYSVDNYNVLIRDGAEDALLNPDALLDKQEVQIGGEQLGLGPDTKVTKFTVWMGYHDVALDSNGNGFTLMSSTQEQVIGSLRVGAEWVSIPEPQVGLLLASCSLPFIRRRRK